LIKGSKDAIFSLVSNQKQTKKLALWVRPGPIPAAEDDQRPRFLQLSIEGLTANKINVTMQLAYKNMAFIIVLQETPYTTADKLVLPISH